MTTEKEKKRRWGIILVAVLLILLSFLVVFGGTCLNMIGGNQTIAPTTTTGLTTTGVHTTGPTTTHTHTQTTTTINSNCPPDIRSNMECICMDSMEAFEYYFNNPNMDYEALQPDDVYCYNQSGPTLCDWNDTYKMYDNCWLVMEPCTGGCYCLNITNAIAFLGTGDPNEMVTHLCKWTLCGIDEWGYYEFCWSRSEVHPDWTVPGGMQPNSGYPSFSGNGSTSGTESPGLGILIALSALAAVGVLAARRH